MRTFIALTFDNNLKKRLGKIQKKIREYSLKGRWVYVDNFHLTLKFLGNISPQEINRIKLVLNDFSKNYSPLDFSLDNLGYFPGKNKFRVVWLGINGDTQSLYDLKLDLENKMNSIGFVKEKRRYTPHITLGRDIVFNTEFSQLKNIISEDLDYDFILDKITFMESKQVNRKRIYEPIAEYKLKG
ncbi:RNA 2',3'-cyclic phosphodiesterase [Thermohalobacter berrensis]|uniref:RNA 2',3'-cyclic phosphodiesterase n=1 Tax=Thermohalobacter berrensis TaxID=99594 RepID=A0A419T6A9_9FIRM|nr:RNA 2',3'-cyclic phosphodiesterase [Thermohalobacter berrensis]RKD33147.1 2'-5' RNA ligase [Thermohalobacter berrensis]